MMAWTMALPAPLRWTDGSTTSMRNSSSSLWAMSAYGSPSTASVTEPRIRPSRSATHTVASAARCSTFWICRMYGWSALSK